MVRNEHGSIAVRVAAKERASDSVVRLVLQPIDAPQLPPWTPGAHIDVELPGCRTRQYSLAGDPHNMHEYVLGVLREAGGSGTSKFIHDELRVDDTFRVSAPRNHFALEPAERYVFIAGGIGITPLVPMVRAAAAAGREWVLHYGGRSRSSMAFRDELAQYGSRVVIVPQDEAGLLDLDTLLREPALGTQVYCCGPEPLLAAVEARCALWPQGALHVERFSAAASAAPVAGVDAAFEIVLSATGRTLAVPADRSILSVLQSADVPVMSSCEEGTCGSCESTVLDGIPDHRDRVLSAKDRARNDCMMVCVSRSLTPRLTLDL